MHAQNSGAAGCSAMIYGDLPQLQSKLPRSSEVLLLSIRAGVGNTIAGGGYSFPLLRSGCTSSQARRSTICHIDGGWAPVSRSGLPGCTLSGPVQDQLLRSQASNALSISGFVKPQSVLLRLCVAPTGRKQIQNSFRVTALIQFSLNWNEPSSSKLQAANYKAS